MRSSTDMKMENVKNYFAEWIEANPEKWAELEIKINKAHQDISNAFQTRTEKMADSKKRIDRLF